MTLSPNPKWKRAPQLILALIMLGMLGSLTGPTGNLAMIQPVDEADFSNGVSSPAQLAKAAQLASLTLGENALIIGRNQEAELGNEAIPFAAHRKGTLAQFSAISMGSAQYSNALRCLSQAVYYEAALEPASGKRAVAQVVLNRLRHPAYPRSVCGVVYEGWSRPVCQFSFVCDGSLRRQPVPIRWRESREIAAAALAGHIEATVGTATHYHADYVLPKWAYTLDKIVKKGRHLFYRFPGSAGRPVSFRSRWSGNETIPRVNLTRLAVIENETDEIPVSFENTENWLEEDPTDRRAANDIGGRMDPSKQWRLHIPDPDQASATYTASLNAQGDAELAEKEQ